MTQSFPNVRRYRRYDGISDSTVSPPTSGVGASTGLSSGSGLLRRRERAGRGQAGRREDHRAPHRAALPRPEPRSSSQPGHRPGFAKRPSGGFRGGLLKDSHRRSRRDDARRRRTALTRCARPGDRATWCGECGPRLARTCGDLSGEAGEPGEGEGGGEERGGEGGSHEPGGQVLELLDRGDRPSDGAVDLGEFGR